MRCEGRESREGGSEGGEELKGRGKRGVKVCMRFGERMGVEGCDDDKLMGVEGCDDDKLMGTFLKLPTHHSNRPPQ